METRNIKYKILLGGLLAIIYSASFCPVYATKLLKTNKKVVIKMPPPEHKPITTMQKYIPGHRNSNQEICPKLGKNIKLLILVTSALTHFDSRMAIRKTWGSHKINPSVLIGFILGSTTYNKLQEHIDNENEMYGDIIQGYFIDSYLNLTLKSISLLEWSYKNCPDAEYILKTDDDAFINVPHLLQTVSQFKKKDRFIYGQVAAKWKTHRKQKSKYFIPEYEYNSTKLPDFTVGVAYLIPSSVVYDLFQSALNHTFMRLEDVYLTGISRQGTNIKLRNIKNFVTKKNKYTRCDVQKSVACHLKQTYSNQFILWEIMLKKTNAKC